jgi:hypothetical protein
VHGRMHPSEPRPRLGVRAAFGPLSELSCFYQTIEYAFEALNVLPVGVGQKPGLGSR